MAVLNRYGELTNAIQRRNLTGCIPWAIEWMIKYKQHTTSNRILTDAQLSTFQDDYDLQHQSGGTTINTFETIIPAIKQNHSSIQLFLRNNFRNEAGARKIRFIDGQIEIGNPCLIPVKYSPTTVHIMPAIEITDTLVKLIWEIKPNGQQIIWEMTKNCLIEMHDMGLSGRGVVVLRD